jgi:hypothetical protein
MLEALSALLGSTGRRPPRPASAAGPVALAQLACGQVGFAQRGCIPEREYSHVVQSPPTATGGWNPGQSQERLIARRQSAAPGAGFPQAQDKSG